MSLQPIYCQHGRAPTTREPCRLCETEMAVSAVGRLRDAAYDELRADKATIFERVHAACEMLLAKGDTEVFNVLTGNGAHVPEVRRDVLAENERLRGLVKAAEQNCTSRTRDYGCPWCGAFVPRDNGMLHEDDCPAFTPDGEVK